MELTGIWKGVWRLEKLSKFLEDEPFKLELLEAEANGNVWGRVSELGPARGIARMSGEETVTYPVKGQFAGERLTLTGMRPGSGPGREAAVQIELFADGETGSLRGSYFYAAAPDRKAIVYLEKTAVKKE